MKCVNCGKELNESAKFCDECGTPVNISADEPVVDTVVEKKKAHRFFGRKAHPPRMKKLRLR